VVAGERADAVVAALGELAQRASPLPFTMQQMLAVDAFLQAPDTPWLQQLAEWADHPPTLAPYGTNACADDGLARECVVLGPGSIDQAHGVEEWVELAELAKLAAIYTRWWGMADA
jgi:acetylornithine deacetylase/succinyl-diaminopimelate desuccinylase-like protein